MANSSLSVPSMSKKTPSAPGLSLMSPAPSLLSLRSVIDMMPNEVRTRYKDAARYTIWPEFPLDGNGQAVEINEEDEFGGSTANLGAKMKRNLSMNVNVNGLAPVREYSKFGNAPVLVEPAINKAGRHRRISETNAGYQSYSPFRPRKPVNADRSVAYYSSKDGVRLVPVSPAEMTRL